MLHLYSTRGDTTISAHPKKCNRMEVSVAEGRWVGQKGNAEQTSRGIVSLAAVFWAVTQRGALRDSPKNGCEGDYSGHERIRERLQVRGYYEGRKTKSVLILFMQRAK